MRPTARSRIQDLADPTVNHKYLWLLGEPPTGGLGGGDFVIDVRLRLGASQCHNSRLCCACQRARLDIKASMPSAVRRGPPTPGIITSEILFSIWSAWLTAQRRPRHWAFFARRRLYGQLISLLQPCQEPPFMPSMLPLPRHWPKQLAATPASLPSAASPIGTARSSPNSARLASSMYLWRGRFGAERETRLLPWWPLSPAARPAAGAWRPAPVCCSALGAALAWL